MADIQFWGGEPLIEWDLMKELVLYAENSIYPDVVVGFGGTTNATLLTEDKFSFLQDHQIFFLISIDGTPDTHNFYRKFEDGRGSHDLVFKNTKKAMERWPFLQVRMSVFPERVSHFFEDIRYLIDNKIINIMWNPVYEGDWTDEAWDIWEDQLYQTVDLMVHIGKNRGTSINLHEFNRDDDFDKYDKYPCGAARHYIGFDTGGEIYICHRFAKFDDPRPWQEKEHCIGHVDVGITRPEVREILINSPVKQGCPAINFDLCGDLGKVPEKVRMYQGMMRRIRKYNKKNLKMIAPQQIMNILEKLTERVDNLEGVKSVNKNKCC